MVFRKVLLEETNLLSKKRLNEEILIRFINPCEKNDDQNRNAENPGDIHIFGDEVSHDVTKIQTLTLKQAQKYSRID